MFCRNCNNQIEDNSVFCPYCGTDLGAAPASGRSYSYTQPEMPMKWYKFCVYFSLWAGAVSTFFASFQYFYGTVYYASGISPYEMYAAFPTLSILDKFYGVCHIAFAVFSIYIALRLLKYCANGPTCYLVLLLLNIIISLLYNIIGLMILSPESIGEAVPSLIGMVLPQIIMFVLNLIYYNKRRHLFIY